MQVLAKRALCVFTILGLLFSGGLAIVSSAYADDASDERDTKGSGYSISIPDWFWNISPFVGVCTQGYSRTFDSRDHNCPGS